MIVSEIKSEYLFLTSKANNFISGECRRDRHDCRRDRLALIRKEGEHSFVFQSFPAIQFRLRIKESFTFGNYQWLQMVVPHLSIIHNNADLVAAGFRPYPSRIEIAAKSPMPHCTNLLPVKHLPQRR